MEKRPFLLIACTGRLSLSIGVIDEYGADAQGFQHIARFFNVTTAVHLIVTAAVYRRLGSELRTSEDALTPPLNVPAPGRRQWVYSALRLRTHLCF